MNKELLKSFINQNPALVKMTESLGYPGIFVLKYTRRVFYDNLWSEELEHCRGTVVTKDFDLIAYPFQKIYNYGIEKNAPVLPLDTAVTAFRKVNGFMVSCTWHNNDLLVSTTGSTDSDFVHMARELIDTDRYSRVCADNPDYTFMFECVHPEDPHIVPEVPGMYLLGYRRKDWGSRVGYDRLDEFAQLFGCSTPEMLRTTLGDLLRAVKVARHEGFVFYTNDGVSSKIKSPYYLMKKWLARNPRTDKIVDLQNDIKEKIEEEFYGIVDAIRANIEEYTAMSEQERLAWIRGLLKEVDN